MEGHAVRGMPCEGAPGGGGADLGRGRAGSGCGREVARWAGPGVGGGCGGGADGGGHPGARQSRHLRLRLHRHLHLLHHVHLLGMNRGVTPLTLLLLRNTGLRPNPARGRSRPRAGGGGR